MNIQLFGRYELTLRRGAEVLSRQRVSNLITSAGENLVANRMFSNSMTAPSHVAFGTSNAAAAKSNAALGAEFAVPRVAFTGGGLSFVSAAVLHLFFIIVPPSPMSNISEIGVFNAAAAGTMVSRAIITPFSMDSTTALTVVWELEFVGEE